MTTVIKETVITSSGVFNFTFDKDLYQPTIDKYQLAGKTLPQIETWMRKTGNKLENGEEWSCAMRYYVDRKFTNKTHIHV